MQHERELTFHIRAEGLEKLKAELESLLQTLQSLLPSASAVVSPAAPPGWATTPSNLAVPPSSLPTAQQAHARGMQATHQPQSPTPPPSPAHIIQHATQPYTQAQQQIAQSTQPPPPPSQQPPPQQPPQQPTPQQGQQPPQQGQPTMQIPVPPDYLPPPPPSSFQYKPILDMLQQASQIGYAGGQIGLGTWGLGQLAIGLRTAIQALPMLGLTINPATIAAAAAMFLIAPQLNAIGRNLGAELMAGITGQGGTTPSTIFFDALTANPLFRVLTWIPFIGPQIEAAVQGYARYMRAYEAQAIAARITGQEPLLSLPFVSREFLANLSLREFSPYYSAVELQRAADLMLQGFRFQRGIVPYGDFLPDFTTRTRAIEIPYYAYEYEPTASLLQVGGGRWRMRRARVPLDTAELAYRYIEQLIDTGFEPEQLVAQPTFRPLMARLVPHTPANILEFTGMLRQSLLQRFPLFGGVVTPIVERVLDELVAAVNTPVMMQLFGPGAVNRWDYALMMLAMQGDPRLLSLQFAQAPDGTNLRDLAWRIFYLQRGQQFAASETARAQIQLAQARRFGTVAETFGAFERMQETVAAEAAMVNRRIEYIREYAPMLLNTPEYRQLLVSAEQLALRLREIAASIAQFRVEVTETASALATVRAEYGLVIARRGTDATVGMAMAQRAETLVRTTEARIAALREMQATVGEVERAQIETQIQQLELQRIAGLESMAVPPPSLEWVRRRAATQAILFTAQTTFAQFADIRALYESLMRQTGERLRAMAAHRERMRERGLWTEEMETRWRQEAMQQVMELAQYQQAYENRWLDRLVAQVWNAPARMDVVAAWFTRREASLFYDIVPWAFGGTRERAQWMRETVPQLYRTLIGRLGTQEGFIETAMAAIMAGAQQSFSGDLRIHIVVEDSGNRLIDAQQVHLNLSNQTRPIEQVTVTVPVPTQ
jgi:hypothetical protein